MFRTRRVLLTLLVILGGSRAYAQTYLGQTVPAVATPVYAPRQQNESSPSPSPSAGTPSSMTGMPMQAPAGTPFLVTGMPMQAPCLVGCNPYEDNNGSLLKGDPMLDGKLYGELNFQQGPLSSGWFATAEANVLAPHVNERMFTFLGPSYQGVTPPLAGFHLNTADLDVTVSPLVRAGYRLGQAAGELSFSYQYVASAGTQLGTDASGNPANVSSHLSVHVFDMDYASREFSLGAWCDMKWFAGIRIANTFFDTQASSSILGQQSVSSNYLGVGPTVGVGLSKTIPGTGLDLFCNAECAVLFGPNDLFFNAGGGATLNLGHTNIVYVPKVEAGIGWRPMWNPRLHFAAGYTFQYWSNFMEASPGTLGVSPDSRGDMVLQGGFLRGEWNY